MDAKIAGLKYDKKETVYPLLAYFIPSQSIFPSRYELIAKLKIITLLWGILADTILISFQSY